MSVEQPAHCALCGASSMDSSLLAGKYGYVCFACLGATFSAVAKTHGKPRGPENAKSVPDATNRCFICNRPVPAVKLIAYRHPFCFCGECLQRAFEACMDENSESLAIVEF